MARDLDQRTGGHGFHDFRLEEHAAPRRARAPELLEISLYRFERPGSDRLQVPGLRRAHGSHCSPRARNSMRLEDLEQLRSVRDAGLHPAAKLDIPAREREIAPGELEIH